MRTPTAVLVAACLLVACSEDRRETQDDAVADSAVATDLTEPDVPFGWMPTAGDTSRPAGTLGDREQAHQVVAVLTEWGIDLSPDTVQAGEVAIALENRGERPHTIEVRNARAGRWRSLPIPPGSTVTLSMPMAPANFEVVSTTEAYVERGMRAVLVVR